MENVTMETPIEVTPPPNVGNPPEERPLPELDDAAVRAAIAQAEQTGQNPERLQISDLSQRKEETPPKETPEIPNKFKTPDGEVDVEKLKASTQKLDEVIQKKEEELKSVDDYVREYREKEAKFRSLPNPQKVAEEVRSPEVPSLTADQIRARIQADMQQDMVGTITDLVDVIVKQRMNAAVKPIEEDIQLTRREREDNRLRENLKQLASKDSRVLHPVIFAAINAKLESDPNLWSLKNPHKSAWLEVKEDLRLGEPSQAQAQPSKSVSPILGGGSPPPAPSSSTPSMPSDPFSMMNQVDLRDRKQEAQGDAAMRAFFAKQDRW